MRTLDEIRTRLQSVNKAEIERATGLPRDRLSKVAHNARGLSYEEALLIMPHLFPEQEGAEPPSIRDAKVALAAILPLSALSPEVIDLVIELVPAIAEEARTAGRAGDDPKTAARAAARALWSAMRAPSQ